MIIDYLFYCRSVTLLIIFPVPLSLTLTATKEGHERSTPVLGVTGLPLFQGDKSWVSAISCQKLPILLWGHLFLLLAAERLINPVHLPHLLQRLLTVSLHLLAGICCPCWSLGQQCLQQMFYPWCPEWGNSLPLLITSAHLLLLFLLSSSYRSPFKTLFLRSPLPRRLHWCSQLGWDAPPPIFCGFYLFLSILYLLAGHTHSRRSINLKHPTSLTVDGMKLFIGTNLWVVNQTDWFLDFFFWDFYMWIKVDGLRSKFGLSAVSLANHIFLISCINGMIRHAYYSGTACYLV